MLLLLLFLKRMSIRIADADGQKNCDEDRADTAM
jgi:hypothetical protein